MSIAFSEELIWILTAVTMYDLRGAWRLQDDSITLVARDGARAHDTKIDRQKPCQPTRWTALQHCSVTFLV